MKKDGSKLFVFSFRGDKRFVPRLNHEHMDWGYFLPENLPQPFDKKILNYDINPDYSEYNDYKKLYFDIVVFNHVLMYMEKKEIISTFENIKKINRNCELIIGIGKGGLMNKLAALLSLNFAAHKGALITHKQQTEILKNRTKILKIKKNIFFMTDIYYTKLNN